MTNKIEFEFTFLADGDHEAESKSILYKEIRVIIADLIVNRAGITKEDILDWSADVGSMKMCSQVSGWHYNVAVTVNLTEEMEVNEIGSIQNKWGGH